MRLSLSDNVKNRPLSWAGRATLYLLVIFFFFSAPAESSDKASPDANIRIDGLHSIERDEFI